MLSWLRRRRDQAERIEVEADALISDLGDGAYSEARRRAREASSDEMEAGRNCRGSEQERRLFAVCCRPSQHDLLKIAR